MIDNRLQYLLLALAGVLLIAGFFYIREVPGDLDALRTPKQHSEDSTVLARLALINTAVSAVPSVRHFEYTGGFENPFKPFHEPPRRGGKSAAEKVPRSKFILKGILTKNKPLAILEDALGETYIRGVGDKVLEQTIVGITNNRVTMRDHLGTYELVVEEK